MAISKPVCPFSLAAIITVGFMAGDGSLIDDQK
jgi:hypothetical protein